MSEPPVLIIGAGPTGLGCAQRLTELGVTNWVLLERSEYVGGLSYTHVDDAGFLWDLGGHVLFSHYAYFDKSVDEGLEHMRKMGVVGGEDSLFSPSSLWCHHQRESWVWMRDRFIPYPLQNNIHRLPPQDLQVCLDGLVDITRTPVPPSSIDNFGAWIHAKFGAGLSEVFMTPYNEKVWGVPTSAMGHEWMGERVATVDLKRVLGNLVHGVDEKSWGPNATFRFPARGGTGAIWEGVASRLPKGHIRLGCEVESVDPLSKVVTLRTGETLPFSSLITTLPMDILVGERLVGFPQLKALAPRFVHSSTHVVGVGMSGSPPPHLAGKCWMYFPEPTVPFYRVTVFSHYAPGNVPLPGKQWSLMCEVAETGYKPAPGGGEKRAVVAACVAGLKEVKFIEECTAILTTFHKRLEYGYPTPFKGRDALVHEVDDTLRPLGVYCRGRFGAWKYEVANQDHSFMLVGVALNAGLCRHPSLFTRALSFTPTFPHPFIFPGKELRWWMPFSKVVKRRHFCTPAWLILGRDLFSISRFFLTAMISCMQQETRTNRLFNHCRRLASSLKASTFPCPCWIS